MDDYWRDFVRESEEHITELNNSLLALERAPTDDDAMEAIFRTAHTLKGNCGAMGLSRASDLAHAIEDLLDVVRAGDVDVTAELMDTIFDGVDELERMIDEVAAGGEITTDPSETIEALRAPIDEAAVSISPPTDAEIDATIDRFDPPADPEHDAFFVRLSVTDPALESGSAAGAGAGANNGVLVVDALIDAFDLLGTQPPRETIEDGSYGGTFDVVFGSAVGETAIAAALEPVDAVADFEIVTVTERFERVEDRPAEFDESTGGDDGDSSSAVDESAFDDSPSDGELSSDEAQDLSVDELLDQFDEFDDLDAMVEEVDDVSAFDEMGDAGSFHDLLGSESDQSLEADVGLTAGDADENEFAEFDDEFGSGTGTDSRPEPDTDAGSVIDTADTADATGDEADVDAGGDDTDETEDDEIDDAGAVFAELKQEVEMVGFDELQAELDQLEFDEFDSDDEVGMDELLGDDVDVTDNSFLDVSEEELESEVDAMLADLEGDDEDEDGDESALEDVSGAGEDEDDQFGIDAEPDWSETAVADEAGAASPTEAESETSAETEIEAPDADDEILADDSAFESFAFDDEELDAEAVEDADDAGEEHPLDDATRDDLMALEGVDFGVLDGDDDEAEDEVDAEEEVDAGDPTLESAADSSSEGQLDETDAEHAFEENAPETGLDATDVETGVEADATGEPGDDTGVETAIEDGETVDRDSDHDPELGPDLEFEDETETETRNGSEFDDGFEAEFEDEFESGFENAFDDDDGFEDDAFDEFDDQFEDDVFETLEYDFESSDTFEQPESSFEPVDSGSSGDDGVGFGDEFGVESGFESESASEPGSGSNADADAKTPTGESDATGAGSTGGDTATETDATDAGATIGSGIGGEDGLEIPDITIPEVPNRPEAERQADSIQSVRVDVEQIDSLLNLVEGLVTSRVRLRHAFESDADPATIDRELDDLEDLTSELQETVMDVRLVPLQTVANRLPRVVRDIARNQDKEVAFEQTGEDVELDRSILDRIGDPLIHLVRNAVDHGIESPDAREEAGKPREGTVELRAERARDRVTIEIEDDGSGLDPDRLRTAAVEGGVLAEAEAIDLEDDDALDLVFHPGLSTAEEVTDVSGRGVGMDVVKRTVEELDGTVSVESEPGDGTTVTMQLPVTVAIADVLFVESGGEEFGIPTKVVQDIGDARLVETIDGQAVLTDGTGSAARDGVRATVDANGNETENENEDADAGDRVPVIDLADALETPGPGANGDGMIVRIRDDVRSVGLHCSDVHGQQEVVIKPFEGFMSGIPGLSGATVRGRGEVVNILDVNTL